MTKEKLTKILMKFNPTADRNENAIGNICEALAALCKEVEDLKAELSEDFEKQVMTVIPPLKEQDIPVKNDPNISDPGPTWEDQNREL